MADLGADDYAAKGGSIMAFGQDTIATKEEMIRGKLIFMRACVRARVKMRMGGGGGEVMELPQSRAAHSRISIW